MSIDGLWPSETVPRPDVASTGIIIGDVMAVCRPALLIPRMVSRYPVLLVSETDLKKHCNNYLCLQ